MTAYAGKRILIIEDNPAYLKIMKLRLQANGFQVLEAIDGLEGLNKAREEVPDMIISDLMLPKMDGHKVVRMVRFDKNLQHIPILMLTSRDLDDDEEVARKCGADAFVVKTTRSEVIMDVIERLFEKAAQ